MLWIGTEGGLNKFDRETETFSHYREKDGLPSDFIHGILEDDTGNLWISTVRGLSKFDPHSETFINYDVEDGLQAFEFFSGSCYRSESGLLFFGGRNGFNVFHPDSIRMNPYVPPVAITDFQIFNKSITPANTYLRQKGKNDRQKISISYRDNVFSFEFAALSYTDPELNRYQYMMEGFDRDWIYAGTRHFVTYTNLNPGKYTFKVKGSNNDGIWNEDGVAVDIVIKPPFWRTIWFIALSVMLGFALIYAEYKRRVKNVLMKTELRAAHDAQMSIMPQSDPLLKGLTISGICIPANEVGGDFFDYIWLNEEKTKFGIVIGDVSGKAMTSAVTAIMSSGMIYSNVYNARSLKDVMTRLNRSIYSKIDKTMFTALCLSAFDLRTKQLDFINAGLSEPLLKTDGAVIPVKSNGPRYPLGGYRDTVYQEKRVQLKHGDVLVFYTDGIVEAQNHVKNFYGENRLIGLLDEMDTGHMSAKEIKEEIIENVKRFSGTASQYDDMAIVVVKIAE